jgi:hypothetical protein
VNFLGGEESVIKIAARLIRETRIYNENVVYLEERACWTPNPDRATVAISAVKTEYVEIINHPNTRYHSVNIAENLNRYKHNRMRREINIVPITADIISINI